jgi:hypothetical protein
VAPIEVAGVVRHAQLFSVAMHGAALLYNLLIAGRYEHAGLTRVEEPVADYREQLKDWVAECAAARHQIANWDRVAMWHLVHDTNPRIGPATRLFVDRWIDAIADGAVGNVADDAGLRRLVAKREQAQKKTQSRLTNDKLLRIWSGKSGSARLTYRWPTVHRLVSDIHAGINTDARS